jgi:hypothetical protein
MDIEELRKEFKDSVLRWRTASLFEETCDDPAKYPPVYCLADSDTSSCVSLKERYLECRDPTEYQFAMIYLGGWEHWLRICDSWILKPHIEEWRDQLALKMRAEAIAKIKELAQGEGPNALQAAKVMLDLGRGTGTKRGRPSKQEKEGFLRQSTKDSDTLKEDAKRLGISLVK